MQATKPRFEHPCFQNTPARIARMHLPVARLCNIKCNFCNPASGDSCVHGCVPGATRDILTPQEALLRVSNVIKQQGVAIQIVGIAGPGEPLFNKETFETVAVLRDAYPEIHICLSTNGHLLPDCVDQIADSGVETLTVTVNSLTVQTARLVYEHILGSTDESAFEMLLTNQLCGIEMAAKRGLSVKVNSVLIPGENEHELPAIARKVAQLGAFIHNVLPLIPRPDARSRNAPDTDMLLHTRKACAEHLCQFNHCRHCRADAIIDATK